MERRILNTVLIVTLILGLSGLHLGLGLSLGWIPISLAAACLLGAAWHGLGWATGAVVRRQGSWWPRRSPCLGPGGGLADFGWHLRDLADFLNANWILAAMVLGGCTLSLPLAPFCLLAWWLGVERGGS